MVEENWFTRAQAKHLWGKPIFPESKTGEALVISLFWYNNTQADSKITVNNMHSESFNFLNSSPQNLFSSFHIFSILSPSYLIPIF